MIGFIGGGNMAEALIRGMTSRGSRAIIVSEPETDKRERLRSAYGITVTSSNREVVDTSQVIILAVKPQMLPAVLDEIGGAVREDQTVVSIAAGVPLSYLSSRVRTRKLVRVMPNTPAIVQEGMSVLSLCECFSDRDIAIVRDIFMSVGKVLTLPEKYQNAVTALSGSGPAFIALFVEALIESGVSMGLDEDAARELAVQTTLGTARLLDNGMPPARLREMVTSPGGTTAAGLRVFGELGFRECVKSALGAALRRAEELGRRD